MIVNSKRFLNCSKGLKSGFLVALFFFKKEQNVCAQKLFDMEHKWFVDGSITTKRPTKLIDWRDAGEPLSCWSGRQIDTGRAVLNTFPSPKNLRSMSIQ